MRRMNLFATTILANAIIFPQIAYSASDTFTVNVGDATVQSIGFAAPRNGWASASNPGSNIFNYVAINFTADTTGSYTFGQSAAPVDTVMAVYYDNSFDLNALVDPDTFNDDGGGTTTCGYVGFCPEVTATLTAGQTNTLVISTYANGASLDLPLSFFSNGIGSISFVVAPSSSSSAFEPVSEIGFSKEMAKVMDALNGGSGSVSTDLSTALSSLSGLSESERTEALKRVSPNASIAFAQATSQTLQRNGVRISDRLSTVRAANGATISASRSSISSQTGLAYSSDISSTSREVDKSYEALTNGDEALVATNDAPSNGFSLRPNSLWGQFYGFKTFQDADDGFAGYESSGHSYLVGYDIAPVANAIVGIAGGYSKTYVDMADYRDGDTSNIDSYQVSLYGSYDFGNNWVADGIFSYVRHQYDSRRGTTLDTATADFGANQFGIRFDVSKAFAFGNGFAVLPKAGLAWSGLYQESYEESGSSLAQSVDASDTQRFRSNVSVEVQKLVAVSDELAIIPSARLGWSHDFLTEGTDVSARFVGGGDGFISTGQALTADTLQVRAGLEIVRNDQLHVDLGANGAFATGFQDYGGQLRVSWNF
ncbi:autotransporter outer membrane beta-barrel domain-containing protein [Roseibium sp. SCP14]|uniref:autotransporter family protein n=1 Tax=Roseibium sp. SCP14 TaxID=3141375 RepID=UPI00333CCF14